MLCIRPESLQAYFTNYLDAHTQSVTCAIIIGHSTVQFHFQFQLLTRRTGSKFYCTRRRSALTKAWGSTFNIYFKCTYNMYFKCKCTYNICFKTFTQLVLDDFYFCQRTFSTCYCIYSNMSFCCFYCLGDSSVLN